MEEKVYQTIKYLGEEDFPTIMATENAAWRKEHVQAGDFQSYDGTRLHYYIASPEQPKAAIVLVHGFCEFWGKYHELAWYFWQAGYAVYFYEQRGHGYSEGKGKELDVVHVDNYKEYVEDLKSFLDTVVMPKTGNLKKILFAHSMGGAVSALFLEQYHDYFDKAILSSPMLKMKAGNYSPLTVALLTGATKLVGKYRKLAPGQKHFDSIRIFGTSSTMSEVRYDYLFNQRLLDEQYQTYGASFGWALASMSATRKLRKHFAEITTPLVLMTAGLDHLVDPEGYDVLMTALPNTKRYDYPYAKHEIFNASEETRIGYFGDVFLELSVVL